MTMKFKHGQTNYETWKATRPLNRVTIAKLEKLEPILEKQRRGETLTDFDYAVLVSLINVSVLHDKLENFCSVSTDPLLSRICQARARIPGSICAACYAAARAAAYNGLEQALYINHLIMNAFLIPAEAWRLLPVPVVNGHSRFQSHGDCDGVICAQNFIRIAESHSFIKFGAWSKNLNYWRIAFREEGKPGNLSFVFSSSMLNEKEEIPEDMKQFIDYRFTVYTPDYIQENDVQINCGGLSCEACGCTCYEPGRGDFDRSERLKR